MKQSKDEPASAIKLIDHFLGAVIQKTLKLIKFIVIVTGVIAIFRLMTGD
jgi:hypothetical protein